MNNTYLKIFEEMDKEREESVHMSINSRMLIVDGL